VKKTVNKIGGPVQPNTSNMHTAQLMSPV